MAPRRALTSPTGRDLTLGAVHANAGAEMEYRRKLARLVDEMAASVLYWLRAAYRANPPRANSASFGRRANSAPPTRRAGELAQDAWPSPVRALLRAIKGLHRRWNLRFDKAAEELAAYFAKSQVNRSDAALRDILKRGGIAIEFSLTPHIREVLKAATVENVGLIKSIQSKYFTEIEGMVMRSAALGNDLQQLTRDLREIHGVTRRRALFIAKDQSNKATSVIIKTRQQEIGVTQAVWLHSGGGNHPRPEHVAWSGKKYDVAKGMWSEVDKAWVWPGTAIGCRCVSKSIVPGYDPE